MKCATEAMWSCAPHPSKTAKGGAAIFLECKDGPAPSH